MAEEEVTSIKEAFPGRCRVVELIEQSNGIVRTITLQPKDMDLTIKYQIHKSYPVPPPVISIKSSSLDEKDNSDLSELLTTKAKQLDKAPMILSLMTEAESWLKENGLGKGTKPKKSNPKSQRKNRKLKAKDENVENDVKQPSMKTATDVIKRIQWDTDLPQEEFIVGYVDRFLGIQEKYFSAFSWEDISSVDYNVLAIPKHRIQYFKFKDVRVWDKNRKLDNVFGSLGSGKTIAYVIENYLKELELQPKEEPIPKPETELEKEADKEPKGNSDDDDSDSDEDDIVVNLDTTSINTNTRALYLDQMKRPTHFIAIKITDKKTVENIVNVQNSIVGQKPQVKDGCMSPSCFHVTLCTLGLDREDKMREACEILRDSRSELSRMKPADPLIFTGVDNFYNRTIYAKIKYPRELLDFVDCLKQRFTDAGIEIRDNYGFVPHSTILKISKQEARNLGTRFLVSDLYREHKDRELGEQSVNRISLCCMGEQRQEDGFWVSLQDIDL